MELFISWSGPRSKAIARALYDWINPILNNVHPWMSDADIESGQRWSEVIGKKLDSTGFGIICVTPENANAPWLNFEAGAISKQVNDSEGSPRVIPLLIDYSSEADFTGPLTQFHYRMLNKEKMFLLMRDLNQILPEEQRNKSIDYLFDLTWPKLDEKIQEALRIDVDARSRGPKTEVRPDRQVLEEVLATVRDLRKSMTYSKLSPTPNDDPDWRTRAAFHAVNRILQGTKADTMWVEDHSTENLSLVLDRSIPPELVTQLQEDLIDITGRHIFISVEPKVFRGKQGAGDPRLL